MQAYERYSQEASRVLALAQEAAKSFGHNYVGSEHILIGLIREKNGLASKILEQFGITDQVIIEEADRLVGRGNYHFTDAFGYTPRTKRILELSLYEAKSRNSRLINTEHILLALMRDSNGVAARILSDAGISVSDINQSIDSGALMPATQDLPNTTQTPTLDKYSRDLTLQARSNRLDPVIGRDTEIQRIIQILCRRTKNNPVLIGEPGVGKSAIIEGLSEMIVSDNVPDILRNKRIVALDIASMIAGSRYRGDFEQRIKAALEELTENNSTILFIDEVHTIVGAGNSEGSTDASNILKPALARGEIQIIGATTLDEYRRYIEKDAALERRFQPIIVGEPAPEEAKRILYALRGRYEEHHKVKITDQAIEAAVDMSNKFISGRFLPDKAIDIMDEASSMVRLSMYTSPLDFTQMQNRLNELLREKAEAINNQNFEKAAAIRDEEKKIRKKISDERAEWEKTRYNNESVVTDEHVAQIINNWTGIPVQRITEDESEKYLNLESILKKRIIGQDEAVTSVCRALRRARAGLKDPNRPIGSFIFSGPTGVGKTELSRTIAEVLFGDENAMIRLDMSEYMEMHSVSKLTGSPPGYVGYDDGGQLTEKVRRQPFCVILLDEIEKAHPDVFNILLQVLEDGRLTDSHGNTVDFRNAIIIMTSNVGSSDPVHDRQVGFTSDIERSVSYERMKEDVLESLKRVFRPEFLNRVDEITIFRPLSITESVEIVKLMLETVSQRLRSHGIQLTIEDNVPIKLAEGGFDPVYGARPLRRAISRELEDGLSEEILNGNIKIGDNVLVFVDNDRLSFKPILERVDV